jgi:hypothetical protein
VTYTRMSNVDTVQLFLNMADLAMTVEGLRQIIEWFVAVTLGARFRTLCRCQAWGGHPRAGPQPRRRAGPLAAMEWRAMAPRCKILR